MARNKRILARVKVQPEGGQANPATVGQALGPHGVNIMEFCRAYNDATGSRRGQIVPAEITVYEDRTFTFVTKTPPTAWLLARAAAGDDRPTTDGVGADGVRTVSRAQLREIAQLKLPDLNTADLDAAERTVAGTARSMGIRVTDTLARSHP